MYAERFVWIDDLHSEDSPANHDLCTLHADRTRPPRGWMLQDRRTTPAALLKPHVETTVKKDRPPPLRRAG